MKLFWTEEGHEKYQIIGDRKRYFNDVEEVELATNSCISSATKPQRQEEMIMSLIKDDI